MIDAPKNQSTVILSYIYVYECMQLIGSFSLLISSLAEKSADTSMSIDRESSSCDQACPDYSTCFNCTSNNCMWCDNLNTCVGKNAYVISFPFGECMSWSQLSSTCHSKDPRFSPSRSSSRLFLPLNCLFEFNSWTSLTSVRWGCYMWCLPGPTFLWVVRQRLWNRKRAMYGWVEPGTTGCEVQQSVH